MMKELGADSLRVTGRFPGSSLPGNSFGRMLAKIALGMAVLKYGMDGLKECYVGPCILERKADTGYWVGSPGRDFTALPREKAIHTADLAEMGREVHALLMLFANYRTPEYRVVVGTRA